MTYEEFKKKIEEITSCTIGYDYNSEEIALECLEGLLARFNLKDERSYVVYYTNFSSLIDLDDDTVYKNIKELVEELVETPVEERVQKQKYYIKLKLPDILSYEHKFINRVTSADNRHVVYTLSDQLYYMDESASWEPQFTIKEFEEIIPEEDRNSFELISVEEDK